MRNFMLGGDVAPLPCPFCGSADTAVVNDAFFRDEYQVHCTNCEATGPTDERNPAVALWNAVTEVLDAVKAETGFDDPLKGAIMDSD